MADAGIAYEPRMLERLDPPLALARARLGPERVTEVEGDVGTPTLELALELLDCVLVTIYTYPSRSEKSRLSRNFQCRREAPSSP
jgi:hypothetical protein